MTPFKAGDIVLVYFPFTHFASGKKRPAIILSLSSYSDNYGDVVILPLTSRNPGSNHLFLPHWEEMGLVKETWIKAAYWNNLSYID